MSNDANDVPIPSLLRATVPFNLFEVCNYNVMAILSIKNRTDTREKNFLLSITDDPQ